MSKRQTDKPNQQSSEKSHLEQTQEGKKKTEINPNYPTADQNNQQGIEHGNQQDRNSGSNQGNIDSKNQPLINQKKETAEESAYDRNKIYSDGKRQDSKTGNQKSQRGNR